MTKNKLPMHVVGGFLLSVAIYGCNAKDSSDNHPSSSSAITITGALNDTGLINCTGVDEAQQACPQAALPNQDAEFGRDAKAALSKIGAGFAGFDWTKLDSAGNPLAEQSAAWASDGSEVNGTRWSCVQDNVTKLMWEVKESDPAHPRYAEHTYTWYDERAAHNGGDAGTQNGGACGTDMCDTQGYMAWANSIALCGHSDWRVPSVTELNSIVVRGKELPAVDVDYFPNTSQPRFFTAQTNAEVPEMAWYVYFSNGSSSYTYKRDPSQLRLVRGGQ